MTKIHFQNVKEQGFSSIEMLVALPLLVLGIVAAVMISFGNQSMALDAESNANALELAQQDSEEARLSAKQDFFAMQSSTSSKTIDGLGYTINRKVTDYPCLKAIESLVAYNIGSRAQYSSVTTMVSNPEEAAKNGYDCSTGFPSPWLHPDTYDSVDLSPSGIKGSDVDVVKINGNRYAILASTFTNDSAGDIWVFDINTLNNPVLIASLNIDGNNKDRGANALDVAQGADGNWYAFIAHGTTATSNYRQLMVVNVTNPANPQLITGATRTLPGVGNSNPEGWRVKFFENKLYIGVRETQGSEFQIYDLTSPTNPTYLSQMEINHNVEDIAIKNQTISGTSKTIAYLALTSSPSSQEVWAVDVTNSASPVKVGGYNGAGDVDARSLTFSGNILFVGKDRSTSNPELLALNINDPSNITLVASKDVPLNPNSSITNIDAIGPYLFMGTSDPNAEFQVWDISNLANIWQRSSFNFSARATGLEYIDNVVVLSVYSNDALHIIYDTDYPPL